ncbi:T9SS type A sorting domain-containing protein [Rhodohalobacter sp. 8-1]|uniref:T9SS type A sorting domain-containing protein n=1 Tax=Rhodohalobacter sp. 8-1 TaxID=3131972 RepID=UPI0030EE5F75
MRELFIDNVSNLSRRLKPIIQSILILTLSLITSLSYGQITVTNTDDSGTGSLRWAIDQANANPDASEIEFDIPGSGPHIIQPQTEYASFSAPINIDGMSEPDYTLGTPAIVIDGSQIEDGAGLVFTGSAGGSDVGSISIINFENSGIRIIGDAVTIEGCFIGVDPDGNEGPNGVGISVVNSVNHQIGGTSISRRNVISANRVGIDFEPGSGLNTVEGNYIGTTTDGTQALGNKFNIRIGGSHDNIIGGTTPLERNIISGAYLETVNGRQEGGAGIFLTAGTSSSNTVEVSTGNIITGNYIGTDVTGSVALPNGSGGVLLLVGSTDNQVGGENTGEGNVISGNGQYGVYFQGNPELQVSNNTVQGNYIGVDATGTAPVPNNIGVFFWADNSSNIIGTNGSASGGNVISGNSTTGILILNGEDNVISGNYIGTDYTGMDAIPNVFGIENRGSGGVIGGTGAESRNIISGNRNTGINLAQASNIVVEGNYIGLNSDGDDAIAGQSLGLRVNSGSGHTITGNTISGHENQAIRIDNNVNGDVGAENITVTGNMIGTDPTGSSVIGNAGTGIDVVGSSNNTIGGELEADRNIISGNGGVFDGVFIRATGITLSSGSNNNTISGNYIGSDANGDYAEEFTNSSHGILISSGSSGNIIGLDEGGNGAGNVISGNGARVNGNGISVTDNSLQNRISGNSIFNNGGTGIDLGDDGTTANDDGDADTGPNQLQNYPVIVSSLYNLNSDELTIEYSISSDISESDYPIEVEFFKNQGNRQGITYLGSDSYEASDAGTVKEVTIPISGLNTLSLGEDVTSVATSADGNSSEFSEISEVVELILPPGIVTLSSPQDGTTDISVNPGLSWQSVSNADTYDVQVSTQSDFSTTVEDFTGLTTTQASVGELAYETVHYWRARAVNEAGPGDWSETRSFTTEVEITDPPAQVTLVSPAEGATDIALFPILSWDSAETAESYTLQVSELSDFSTLETDFSGITFAQFEVGELSTGTQYYWRVRAVNEVGSGDWSEVWSFTTEGGATNPPAKVTLVSPEDEAQDVDVIPLLSWQAVDDADSYSLQVSASSDFSMTFTDLSDLTSTQLEVDELAQETTYFWRVRAENEAGIGDWSDVWSFTTELSPPSVVVLISPEDDAQDVSVMPLMSWDDANGAETYSLQVSTSPDFSTTVTDLTGQTNTQIEIGQLDFENVHFWRVRAENESGFGPWSDVWSFTTEQEPTEPPAKVTLLTPEDGSVDVTTSPVYTWESIANAETYTLQISKFEDFSELENDFTELRSTERIIRNYDFSTQYFWRVRAFNDGGAGEWSDVWTFTTMDEPITVPEKVTLSSPSDGAQDVDASPLLSWESVEGAESYRLQVTDGTDFSTIVTDLTDLSDTNEELDLLAYETEHFWRVRAVNEAGEGEWSDAWSFTTQEEPMTIPDAPVLISPEQNATDIELSASLEWSAADGAETFILELSENIGFSNLVENASDIPGTTFQTGDLNGLTTYFWRVRAVNEVGISNWSETRQFTTMEATSITDVSDGIPQSLELSQNYPNPFNPSTEIEIGISEAGEVRLTVYDMLGRSVGVIVNENLLAGRYSFRFDASNLTSGTYMYRLETRSETRTRKMTLIK